MTVMRQVVPAQKESCTVASATPPALKGGMSRVALSDERLTWYSEPLYAPYNARVVLCAATHGVPPEA